MIQPESIRVGIVGYGNLGRGVEAAIGKNPDMEMAGIFTRRDPASIRTASGSPAFPMDALPSHRGSIDVAILCGGSKSDLPEQGPDLAAVFNTVDSFDTHARIPQYFAAVDAAARAAGTTSLISAGWDPGLFSVLRALGGAVLPDGDTYTFWGRGVSQGHSDALRRIPGVAAAVQYTVPVESAVAAARSGLRPQLSTRQKHLRECYVVLADSADSDAERAARQAQVREAIVTMPDYFADYDTSVTFVTAEELASQHGGMPHGGFVMRSGTTGADQRQLLEFRLELSSNPEFTSSVLVAYARAVHRLARRGEHGAKTVYDVPVALLSPLTPEQLRAQLL